MNNNLKKRPDGRYACSVYIGKDDNGKRKYKTVYGRTKKEVNQKYEALKLDLNKGLDVFAQKDTFGKWKDEFLKLKRVKIQGRYYDDIISMSNHFSEIFETEIVKIRPIHIQNILNSLAESGLSAKRLKDIRNVANNIFELAINNRVMDFNPVKAVEVPEGRKSNRREPITDEQIRWINEMPHRMQIAAMIMLYAGLRKGELIALTWSDIDLSEQTIRVNKSVEFIKNKPRLKSMTKTEAGMRLVSIPKVLCEFLSKQKPTSIFVLDFHGEMMSGGNYRRLWSSYMSCLNAQYGNFENCLAARKKDGSQKSRTAPGGLPMVIKPFTAHQLRHTYASMLYKAGIDILTAKEQMGHSDLKTTLSIYTHLDSMFKKRSMQKLDSFIQKNELKFIG